MLELIDLKPKETYSDSLPRCPVPPSLRREVEALSKRTGLTMSELQRRAVSLFLSRACQDWRDGGEDAHDAA